MTVLRNRTAAAGRALTTGLAVAVDRVGVTAERGRRVGTLQSGPTDGPGVVIGSRPGPGLGLDFLAGGTDAELVHLAVRDVLGVDALEVLEILEIHVLQIEVDLGQMHRADLRPLGLAEQAHQTGPRGRLGRA